MDGNIRENVEKMLNAGKGHVHMIKELVQYNRKRILLLSTIFLLAGCGRQTVNSTVNVQSTKKSVEKISLDEFCSKYNISILDNGYEWNEADGASSIIKDGSSRYDSNSYASDTEDDAGAQAVEVPDTEMSFASSKGADVPLIEVTYEEAQEYLTKSDQKMICQFFDNTDNLVITPNNRDENGTFLEYDIGDIEDNKAASLRIEEISANSAGRSFFSSSLSDQFAVRIGGTEWLGLRLESENLYMISFQKNRRLEFYFDSYEEKDIIDILNRTH